MLTAQLIAFLVRVDVALAQSGIPKSPLGPPSKIGLFAGGFPGIVCTGLRWLFTAAIIFSIILALVAAFDYMRSAGDAAMVKKATNRLVFVAIGVAIAILARTLPVLVGTVIGTATTSTDTSSLCPSR